MSIVTVVCSYTQFMATVIYYVHFNISILIFHKDVDFLQCYAITTHSLISRTEDLFWKYCGLLVLLISWALYQTTKFRTQPN